MLVRSEATAAAEGQEMPARSVSERSGTMAVAVILPVMDETESLRKTVEILLAENGAAIRQILIVVSTLTSAAARAVCAGLEQTYPGLIEIREQRRPYLGGAMQDAFEWARGSHILMMASDLETDPATVKALIAGAREGWDIVTASRWTESGAFEGYSPPKRVLNWIFQRAMGLLFGTGLSDLTYGFRIFEAKWVRAIRWEELRHPLLLESILKPLRLGARIREVPTVWRARTGGVSHNSFWRNFEYFRIALRVRFLARRALLKEPLECARPW